MNQKNIAVIGAGLAGLTCAYELQKAGHNVEVFEKEVSPGGRSTSRTKDGLVFDIGANHYINLYEEIRKYSKEFGIEWQPFEFVRYQLFKDGKLINLFDALSGKEKIKLAKAYLKYKNFPTSFLDSSTLAEYDEGNAYDVATQEIGEGFANDIVDTYVGVYQFHRAKEISKAALYSQLNSTKSFVKDWYLHRTVGGKIALPQAFADRLSVSFSTPVDSLETTDSGVTVSVGGEQKQYDLAVIATTASAALALHKNPTDAQQIVLKQTKFAPSIIAAFTMPKDQFGPCTDDTSETVSAVWVPYSESKVISSYSNESEKGSELISNDKTLLLVFFREDGAEKYLGSSDEEIYEVAKQELARTCPLIQDLSVLQPHDIHRWEEAMPKFYEGSLKTVKQFLDNHQGENNVWLAGDYLNAPWTEGAVRCGQRVAKQICEQD